MCPAVDIIEFPGLTTYYSQQIWSFSLARDIWMRDFKVLKLNVAGNSFIPGYLWEFNNNNSGYNLYTRNELFLKLTPNCLYRDNQNNQLATNEFTIQSQPIISLDRYLQFSNFFLGGGSNGVAIFSGISPKENEANWSIWQLYAWGRSWLGFGWGRIKYVWLLPKSMPIDRFLRWENIIEPWLLQEKRPASDYSKITNLGVYRRLFGTRIFMGWRIDGNITVKFKNVLGQSYHNFSGDIALSPFADFKYIYPVGINWNVSIGGEYELGFPNQAMRHSPAFNLGIEYLLTNKFFVDAWLEISPVYSQSLQSERNNNLQANGALFLDADYILSNRFLVGGSFRWNYQADFLKTKQIEKMSEGKTLLISLRIGYRLFKICPVFFTYSRVIKKTTYRGDEELDTISQISLTTSLLVP